MTSASPPNSPATTREQIAALLGGFGLQVDEHPYEITATNPREPERGIIHIATDDAYVSWEQPLWHYWGALEGHQAAASDETTVTAEKIIQTLVGPASP